MHEMAGRIQSEAVPDNSSVRFWLCGAVVTIYFGSFISLLSLSRSSAAASTDGITTSSILLILCCMAGCVSTTALFVFLRRDN